MRVPKFEHAGDEEQQSPSKKLPAKIPTAERDRRAKEAAARNKKCGPRVQSGYGPAEQVAKVYFDSHTSPLGESAHTLHKQVSVKGSHSA